MEGWDKEPESGAERCRDKEERKGRVQRKRKTANKG